MQKLFPSMGQLSVVLIPFCLILLGCGLWPEMELLVPSFPDMKRFFDVNDGQIQQLLTTNFCGFLIGVLFAGPLCDSIGRRPVLVYGAITYLLVSCLSALATSFPLLMLARFLQGLSMTGPMIAGCVLLLEVTAGARQVFWMSLSNSAVTFCMAAAPIVGSWVNASFGFQGNLWAIVILGCVGVLPSLFFVKETMAEEKKKPLRFSSLINGYWLLLRDWRFMSLALPICGLAAAYWIYVGVSALYMVDYLALPASHFGRYQGPIVGCFSVISLGSGWLLKRLGLMRCIKWSLILMFVGGLSVFVMSLLAIKSALATTILMMVYVGGMAPLCSLLFPYCLNHLPSDLQGNAQALIQALRLFMASLGASILGFVYKGPLLPVAILLLFALCGSTILLYMGRRFIGDGDTAGAWSAH